VDSCGVVDVVATQYVATGISCLGSVRGGRGSAGISGRLNVSQRFAFKTSQKKKCCKTRLDDNATEVVSTQDSIEEDYVIYHFIQ
jgi:hypothetical protein